MKKIIIIALSLFVLVSCGFNEEIKNNVSNNTKKKEIKVENTNLLENKQEENISSGKIEGQESILTSSSIVPENKKITISELKSNLEKLKSIGIGNAELEMLNSQILNIYDIKIEQNALEKKDINLCEKLSDKYNIINCRKDFIIQYGEIKSCDNFEISDIKRNCKNGIYEKEAIKKLDISICDKLIFQKQEKLDNNLLANSEKEIKINDCKNRVYENKAIKNLDSNICDKISYENEIGNCKELVRMEKEARKFEEQNKNNIENKKIGNGMVK